MPVRAGTPEGSLKNDDCKEVVREENNIRGDGRVSRTIAGKWKIGTRSAAQEVKIKKGYPVDTELRRPGDPERRQVQTHLRDPTSDSRDIHGNEQEE